MIGGIVSSTSVRKIPEEISKYFRGINETDSIEIDHILQDFSLLDKSYLVNWHPIILSSAASLWRCAHLLDGTPLAKLTSEDQVNALLCNLILPSPRSVSQGRDDLIHSSTLLASEGMYIMDTMHLFSNFTIRCCACLNNQIPTHKEKGIVSYFGKLFNSFLFTSSISNKQPGVIPLCVNALACERIRDLRRILKHGEYSWITDAVIIPNNFKQLNCEQRIMLYFNLFRYMYSDSLFIPAVHYMAKVISIAAELFVMERDYNLASVLQTRLSFYLSCLESNTLPNFPCTTTHLMNHLFRIILYSGPIHGFTAFNREHLYKYTKKSITYTRDMILSANKRELVKTLAVIVEYHTHLEDLRIATYNELDLTSLDLDLQTLKNYAIRNLVDDHICFYNANKIHKTHVECVLDSTEAQWELRFGQILGDYEMLDYKHATTTMSRNGTLFRSVPSCDWITTLTPQWLCNHRESIGWSLGYDRKICYFVVWGFLLYKFLNHEYPLALCSAIPVKSTDTETYTYHDVLLDGDYVCRDKFVLVSMYRLQMKPLTKWYGDGTLGFSPMRLGVYQFNEIKNDGFFRLRKHNIV